MTRKVSVSSFGYKILQKLKVRGEGKLFPDGRLGVGPLIAPKGLVKTLLKNDLVQNRTATTLEISEPGEMLLRRFSHLQKKAKNPNPSFPSNPFQGQHSRFRTEKIKHGKRQEKIARNIGDSPLSWLSQRRDKEGKPFISRAHLEAGEKLSKDFEFAGRLPRTTAFYDGVPISKTKGGWREADLTDLQMAAKKRVDEAMSHVGPGLSDILIRVCCFHEGLEQAERTLAWPSRSGKVVLRIGLDRLADFYKIK